MKSRNPSTASSFYSLILRQAQDEVEAVALVLSLSKDEGSS